MATYRAKAMETLASELQSASSRNRRRCVDAAEELLDLLEPSQHYPYEFVIYRLTGYRGRGREATSRSLSGEDIHHDLLRLMLDVSASMNLKTGDYPEKVYDTAFWRTISTSRRKPFSDGAAAGCPHAGWCFPTAGGGWRSWLVRSNVSRSSIAGR